VKTEPIRQNVPDDYERPDGTSIGEPEVRVRCADCHGVAWVRISEVETARCVACRRKFRPELRAIDGDGDGETAEQLHLPVLELIDGEVP
jgi:hypothetical protein